jgi:hypothetical protein
MHKKAEEQAEAQRALQSDVAEIRRLLTQRDSPRASPCGDHGAGPGGGRPPAAAAKGGGACTACGCCCAGRGDLGGREQGAAGPSCPDSPQVMVCRAGAERA